ncbi:DNA-binding protein, excisionase family [Nostocoides japonicum T1-X7]|uniref:DNA-binding protein, excisionase family n=1 Tax=Nostocoides japonicum T1-X7 TaxID=1194083 RepID=A0A077LYD7_9MICO|nr:helix-turn-helix domain-containing protein [Tetrasphaera japonica]CCH78928.1 DNA-binding protein, excisionase family [Tetrasphaera japonica T1-X7]
MATLVESTNRVIATEHDARAARGVLDTLRGPEGRLQVEHEGQLSGPIPAEIGRILQHVLEVMATGGTVTISSAPEELTTSSAAAILGISRPTLLKIAAEGRIPSHRVGTHTRFMANDIFSARRARRERERVAFAALREAEDDEV